MSRSDSGHDLPPVWLGPRRRYLAVLIGSGLGQALVAGVGAHVVIHMLRGTAQQQTGALLLALTAAAVLVGVLRTVERVVTERLSQEYVHEIRLGLVRRNLSDGTVANLGVAVARTTNDLSSVKNWISEGIAPLAIGVPLLLGVGVALALIDPVLALGLVPSILLLLWGLRWLTPIAYRRTRDLRRARGRLSGQIADTILSTASIRSGGGATRELNRVARHSSVMVGAAIERARWLGAIRGLAAATSGLAMVSTVGAGVLAGLPASHLAASLTLTGLLATPLHDLGKAAEFRQTYRAARRIIGPAVEIAPEATTPETQRPPTEGAERGPAAVVAPGRNASRVGTGRVLAEGLRPNGVAMPPLIAAPGDRVLVETGDLSTDSALLEMFAGLREAAAGTVEVDGFDLGEAGSGRRRRLVGFGARGMLLPRTTISRAVAYRTGDEPGTEATRLLGQVGLADRVSALAKGPDTLLRHGGEPLTIPERARLVLARSLFREPPLLVFDHLDADLGRVGRRWMRGLLRDYPGVVLLTSDVAEEVVRPTLCWRPEGLVRLPVADGAFRASGGTGPDAPA